MPQLCQHLKCPWEVLPPDRHGDYHHRSAVAPSTTMADDDLVMHFTKLLPTGIQNPAHSC